MKKIFSAVLMTAVVCGFMSCGNSKVSDTEKTKDGMNETEKEEQIDTTAADTADEVVRGDAEGFGRCLESGCYCKAFKGRGQTCRNCGHAYRRHY